MTSTAAPTVKDHELVKYGLVESASVNSITDFKPSKLYESKPISEKGNEDFSNIFICHLIFYAFYCVALLFHILIDFGLGSFLKEKFLKIIGLGKKTVFSKSPAFA